MQITAAHITAMPQSMIVANEYEFTEDGKIV
jgi:hypothetical protein